MKKFSGSRVLPALRPCCRVKTPLLMPWHENQGWARSLFTTREHPVDLLYPGVRRAGILLGPVGRPPRAGVKVHIVGGGFQSVRLGAVVDCGRVGDDLFQVRVVIAVGMLQVHSVCIIVPPAGIFCVIHRLRGDRGRWTMLDELSLE